MIDWLICVHEERTMKLTFCDVCKEKIEGGMFYTIRKSGINLSEGYHEDNSDRCFTCDARVETFIKSITKNK